MKKSTPILMITCLLLILTTGAAQSLESPQGIYVGYAKSLVNSFDTPLKNGFQIEYLFDQPGFLEFSLPFTFARTYPVTDHLGQETDSEMLTLDALVHFQLTAPERKIIPKFYAGPGFLYETSGRAVFTGLIGGEIGYRFHERAAFVTGVQYRIGLERWGQQATVRVGMVLRLGSSTPVEEPLVIADMDLDGVPDEQDLCPDIPGDPAQAGCPDTDRDGLTDAIDRCPTLAGLDIFNGCPDTDQDGVPDHEDYCAELPGKPEDQGCPNLVEIQAEITELQAGIQFEPSNSQFLSSSYEYLEQIRALLERYPHYYLRINGHTDSIGSTRENEILSEQRAKACYDYLAAHGIDPSRMFYMGYGETRPIADNRYEAGRRQNRRVEFIIIE